jgi:hypothetical protein
MRPPISDDEIEDEDISNSLNPLPSFLSQAVDMSPAAAARHNPAPATEPTYEDDYMDYILDWSDQEEYDRLWNETYEQMHTGKRKREEMTDDIEESTRKRSRGN